MFGHHHGRGPQGWGAQSEKARFFNSRMQGAGSWRRPKYNVPVNVIDSADHFQVNVYAVGFSKENIKINIENDVLYISGTRSVDESNLPVFSQQEFPIKSFERVLSLNGKVDIGNISAKQEEGILMITLPKNEEAKQPSKDIPVN